MCLDIVAEVVKANVPRFAKVHVHARHINTPTHILQLPVVLTEHRRICYGCIWFHIVNAQITAHTTYFININNVSCGWLFFFLFFLTIQHDSSCRCPISEKQMAHHYFITEITSVWTDHIRDKVDELLLSQDRVAIVFRRSSVFMNKNAATNTTGDVVYFP